jgi:DNA-binding CsgD family transcriptional regulator
MPASAYAGGVIRGRDAELAKLAALRDATTRAAAVLVTGVAGIGKTALLDEAARGASDRGARVVRAVAPEGGGVRFALVDDVVRGLQGQARFIGADADADSTALRALSGSPGPGVARVAGALLHLVIEAARSRPILLVLDDLHWADPDSLAALTIAVGRLHDEPVVALGAARPTLRSDPRLARWERIDLGPLAEQDAIAVLEETCRRGIPVDHARRIVRALDCTPLAIVECPRLLSADQIDGAAALPDPLPVGERLIAAWAGAARALPPRTVEALLVVCVLGDASQPLLDGTLARRGVARADLGPAMHAGLVVGREARPELTHALARAAILQDCDPDRVASIHRDAAGVAQQAGAPPEILVEHLVRCAADADELTAPALEQAAEEAWAAGRIQSSVRGWAAAARISTDPVDRARRAASAVRVLMGHSLDLCEAGPLLALVGDLDLSAEDRVWVDFLEAEHLAQSDVTAAIARAREALARATDACPGLVLPLAWSAVASAWAAADVEAAVDSARVFVAWEQAHGSDGPLPLAPWTGRALLGAALFSAGRYAESAALLADSRRMSRGWRATADTTAGELLYVVLVDLVMQDVGQHVEDRVEALAHRLAHDRGDTWAATNVAAGMYALRRGAWGVARTHLDAGLALARGIGAVEETLFGLGVAVELEALTGDREALAADVAELRTLARRVGAAAAAWAADRALGLEALGRGDLDAALGHLQPLAATPVMGHREQSWRSRMDLVEALSRSGEHDSARRQLAEMVPALAALDSPLADVLLERSRALLAQPDAAEDHFRRALAALPEARCPLEAARTHLALGEHLRRNRRRVDARAQLRIAAAGFEQLGAPAWLGRAREELRVAGDGQPRAAADPLDVLTPQERRIAEEAATGASNREIAATMALSRRTVEFHLVSVFRKLGVTNRTGLAHLVASRRGPPAGSPW